MPCSRSRPTSRPAGPRGGWRGPRRGATPGRLPDLVWGLCAGSGRHPYQVIVELSGPAYKCSCPSRKLPCKHTLALLLAWANGEVPDQAQPSDYAVAWAGERRARAVRTAARASSPAAQDARRHGEARSPAEAATARKRDSAATARRAQRAERIAAGLSELPGVAARPGAGRAGLVRPGDRGRERGGRGGRPRGRHGRADGGRPGTGGCRGAAGPVARPDVRCGLAGPAARRVRAAPLAGPRVRAAGGAAAGLAATVRTRIGYTTGQAGGTRPAAPSPTGGW